MSKLRPVPKISQVKPQSLDYLANKVPVDLRGWVAVVEIPHWFAWHNGPTPKKRAARLQIFGSKYKKGRRGFSFARRGVFLACKEVFRQGKGLFL